MSVVFLMPETLQPDFHSALETRWVVWRDAEIFLKEWEDGTVIFDEASGQLNCLTLASGALVEALLEKPGCSTHELACRILGSELGEDEYELVEKTLAELSALRFIERATA